MLEAGDVIVTNETLWKRHDCDGLSGASAEAGLHLQAKLKWNHEFI